tara:strand:+ start:437 stop:661 length:225 start_codon:yes stop_codon:yes gene_type:complete
MDSGILPWEKGCHDCQRIIQNVRREYEKLYLRPMPSYSNDGRGNYVCLDCSPENIFLNRGYDFSDENLEDNKLN